MKSAFMLRVVGLFVLVPTTLVAAFGSVPVAGLSVDAIRSGQLEWLAIAPLVALVAGWFGIVTLWRLYDCLLHGRHGFHRGLAWAGLACGSAVSATLVATGGGSTMFRVLFFGWPLLAVAFFVLALLRLRARPGQSPG